MPRFRITVSWPSLDRDRFLSDFMVEARQIFIKAGRKFLRAAAPRIPIWTGMARGGLQTLEEVVGRLEPSGRISNSRAAIPRVRFMNRTFIRRGYYYRGIERNFMAARRFITPPDRIFTEGRVSVAKIKTRLVFDLSIDIDYFTRLDKQWGSMVAGRAAFIEELRLRMARSSLVLRDYIRRVDYK